MPTHTETPDGIPDESLRARIRHAAEIIDQADGMIIAAGAGIGVDSGLPDFRGPEGFWQAYPALGRAGLGFMDVANPRAFGRTPVMPPICTAVRSRQVKRPWPTAVLG